jgi:hypothetical protein
VNSAAEGIAAAVEGDVPGHHKIVWQPLPLNLTLRRSRMSAIGSDLTASFSLLHVSYSMSLLQR